VTGPPPFDELVSQIERRTAMMHAAVTLADTGAVQVRERPRRTLRDLMFHVGNVQRAWAEAIPDWRPPPRTAAADQDNEGGLYGWAQRSTTLLVYALRSAGPDLPSHRLWAPGQLSMTVRHVARRQLQEATVHAYDALQSIGRPAPVPDEIAINGLDEFLRYRLAAPGPWPYRPAQVEVRASMTPARSGAGPVHRDPPMVWMLDLSPEGIHVIRRDQGKPVATMTGRAGDLLLALYGRTPMLATDTAGDETVLRLLLERVDTSCT
jgi:uncharacterized protein (TIGR03083 family)